MEFSIIQKIAFSAIPVIFAITVHEAAHGYAAKYFGDSTAERLGRISLNPIKHIDPIGTIVLPALTMLVGGVLFGWAKPVPVNFNQLRNPKKDMFWVAAAGPASNLGMAIFWAVMLNFSQLMPVSTATFFEYMAVVGLQINLILMVLNLIPLPPLDGGRIAVSLLPMDLAVKLARVEKYGFVILIILLFTGLLGKIILPIVNVFLTILVTMFT